MITDREESVSKIKILLVEDDHELLNALVDTLSMEGYSVHGVNKLSSAKTYLKNHQVDLVVSDVNFSNKIHKNDHLFTMVRLIIFENLSTDQYVLN